ncbi:hypothetical protein J437_LFUL009072 [Ladona fulva]|uniref:Uncharacterized protein n=1 Tax=Ladona fulva TaxID=123851 RepID=A0A8K0K7I7_LADFU|nr:hypothetical protein J437_LFUL009072 [Ladona fulva]
MAASQVTSGAVLEETFYIFSKKKTVYRVRLTEKGLNLQKESNGSTKTEAILLSDIVGCRCVRSRRKSESCVCRPSVGGGGGPGSGRRNGAGKGDRVPSYVDDNSSEQDENDINAYLHIYAYVLKKRRGRVKSDPQQASGKRERTTITLRFRSFDRYEENLREAQRWRVAIKCLMRNKPVPKSVLCNGDAYEPGKSLSML